MNATTTRLLSVATQQNLEAWWYPLWTYQLSVYSVNYLNNPQLSVAPQPSLRNPGALGPRYLFPDFAIVETQQADGQPATKELQLVMEVKRRATALALIQARLKTRRYLTWAIRAVNNPNQAQVYGIATAGRFWQFRRVISGGGAGAAWAFGNWSISRTPAAAFSTYVAL